MAIADGIGGNAGGDVAAETALKVLQRSFSKSKSLARSFTEVQKEVDEVAESDPTLKRMGTTLSAGFLSNNTMLIAHVGDTRIYHLRGNGLVTLTRDHTETAELVRRGILDGRQAKKHPRRNVLTSAIVAGEIFELFENEAELRIGDRILFLTDGVYNAVSKSDVARISSRNADLVSFLGALRNQVEDHGPKDNFSALGIEFIDG